MNAAVDEPDVEELPRDIEHQALPQEITHQPGHPVQPPAIATEAAEASVDAAVNPTEDFNVKVHSLAQEGAAVEAETEGDAEIDEYIAQLSNGSNQPIDPSFTKFEDFHDNQNSASMLTAEDEEAPQLVPVAESLPPLPETTHHPDSPTLTLITTLRQQITLLTDQGLALNTKLVTSLDRLSTIEDALESTRQTTTTQAEKIAALQKEKDQWEESMSTGLLVERGTIKEEMQKLVEGLVEEERKRGSAELGRKQVEQEVDDLSATLFEQANNMVAEQRLARIQANPI